MDQLRAVSEVIRALADARYGAFYELFVDLPFSVKPPSPKIDFSIRHIADRKNAVVIVSVSLTRPDWVEVLWSLSVETTDEALMVTGSVEIETDEGWVEVYTNSHALQDLSNVAATIHTVAGDVCGQRSWVTRSSP